MSSTDFEISDLRSIVVITPRTEAALDWTEANITSDETQWWAQGFVCEPRYAETIIEGIIADGLTVS